MRRLVLALVVVLALSCASSASAAGPNLIVTKGSARAVDGKLKGWFVVANRGTARSRASVATVGVAVGKPPLRVRIHWRPRRAKIPALAPSETRRVRVSVAIPEEFGTQRSPIHACIAEHCRVIGRLTVASTWEKSHRTGEAHTATTPTEPPPISSVPTDPISHPVEEPFSVSSGGVHYYGFVPGSYDGTNQTAPPLLIWLHGCYGEAEGDAWVVDPGEEQDWLTLSLAGREEPGNECWIPSVDEAKVMAALADFETHFNVDRRRVILAGYSSGGDLAYRTGFRHSSTFAGLLIANSTPFRDTESSAAESLAAATTKFHIVALAHEEDETYPLATVVKETNEVKAAGFPLTLIERRGEHWNEPGEKVEGVSVPGTDADIRTYLLPHIDDGWLAPVP